MRRVGFLKMKVIWPTEREEPEVETLREGRISEWKTPGVWSK